MMNFGSEESGVVKGCAIFILTVNFTGNKEMTVSGEKKRAKMKFLPKIKTLN